MSKCIGCGLDREKCDCRSEISRREEEKLRSERAEAVRLLRCALDHCVGCDACMHTSEFLARVGNRALNVGLFNAIYALAPGDLGGEG